MNGNGSSKEYHGGSKPNRSFCGVTKLGSGLSHTSSSASASSSSVVRPMGIPDSSKRPKLTFIIGQNKPVRPTQTRSSPNCSLSSASHPQPTSASTSVSTSGFSQVNGTHTGASFLVPYGQESSEESDQEAGALENGSVKPYLAPKITNGKGVKDDTQSHNSSSLPQLTPKTNGSNSFPELHVRENGSGPAHKSQNGLPKANGFNHVDKVHISNVNIWPLYYLQRLIFPPNFFDCLFLLKKSIVSFFFRLWVHHILHHRLLINLIVQTCNTA